MQLTTNFNLSEFRSRDGAAFPDSVIPNIQRLANALQDIVTGKQIGRAHV